MVLYWPGWMSVPTTRVPSLNVAPVGGAGAAVVDAAVVGAFVGVGAAAVTVCVTVDGARDTETVTGAGLAVVFEVFDVDAAPMATPMSNATIPAMAVGRTQARRHQGRFGAEGGG